MGPISTGELEVLLSCTGRGSLANRRTGIEKRGRAAIFDLTRHGFHIRQITKIGERQTKKAFPGAAIRF